MSLRHPVFNRGHSYKMSGVWVRDKRTDAIGFINFVVKYWDHTGLPADIYVVKPPTPYNKEVSNIKTYSGSVLHTSDIVRLKRRRRKTKWN